MQFVNGSASGADVGALRPFQYVQDNPLLAVAQMQTGQRNAAALHADAPSLRFVPDVTANNTLTG